MHSATHRLGRRGLFSLIVVTAFTSACENSTSTPNRPPATPIIDSPQSGAVFVPGDPVQFQGSATDPEDGVLSGVRLSWTSNLDGQLGTGASITVDDLSEGSHTVTLRATDSDGLTSNATVAVTVQNLPPVAMITDPESGSTFSPSQDIDFEGSATDPEDGSITGAALVWTSNQDGEIGTGSDVSTDDLSEGDHTITLTATDSHGATGTATISLTIADRSPTATIASPSDGAVRSEGATVQFQGSASDPEDGALTGSDLVWTSSIDGEIGTGTSFSRSDLSLGEHEIVLTATDSRGNTGTATAMLTIQGVPTVTIIEPLHGASFAIGASIRFTGSATGAQGEPLVGSSLVWTSDLDGQIGLAETFTTTSLSEGDHTITLTATDAEGVSASASIDIAVQTASSPTASIASPITGASFAAGQIVTFVGSATDPEDGTLSGASLVWRSSINGEIGTGQSFQRSDLTPGQHLITLTATDAADMTGTAVVMITITGPPNASITAPASGTHFSQGDDVEFVGSGGDPEDGALTGASLVWTSDRDGQIGTGTSFSTSTLSRGTHTITLTATDSDGLTATAQVTVVIDPPGSPPTVNITAPSNGGSAAQGATVVFESTATDPEDGNLTGASLVWTSNRDGQLDTGTSFSTSVLSVGTHTITLTGTDSDGWSVTDQISYTITSSSSPIEVQVGSSASSTIVSGGQTTLPIIVDMSNAAGRDVATLQLKVSWNAGTAQHVSSNSAIGATLNTSVAGEVSAVWTAGAGNTSTFTLFELTLQGATPGMTDITIDLQLIADEVGTDLSGDTGTRNHSLTVN